MVEAGDDGTETVPLVAELGVAIPVPVDATTGLVPIGLDAAAAGLVYGAIGLVAKAEADETGQALTVTVTTDGTIAEADDDTPAAAEVATTGRVLL